VADENFTEKANSSQRTSRGRPLKNVNEPIRQEPSRKHCEVEAKQNKESEKYAGTSMLQDAMLSSSPSDEPHYDEPDYDVQVVPLSMQSALCA
jgi:hypothetical protein